MRSIGQILDANKGIGPGFGFIRIALAITIIAWHSLVLALGDRSIFDREYIWSLNYSLLPMFFGLSGFLIAGSAVRLRMRDFFINRGARIFPALAVETMISAMIIGPIITSLPLGKYFSDPGFWEYFQNMYGAVVYVLPGVVFVPPYPIIVNGVIWTIPIELGCYVVMGIVMALKLHRYPWALIGIGVGLLLVPYAINTFHLSALAGFLASSNHLSFLNSVRGDKLLPSFLFGIAAYHLRQEIPLNKWFMVLLALGILSLGLLGDVSDAFAHWWVPIVLCISSVVLVAQFGCVDLEKVTPRGDYSYGLYIYAFPIQQIVNKELHIGGSMGFAINFSLSLIIAFGFAFFSWHLIEKPVLKFRKRFSTPKASPLPAVNPHQVNTGSSL